ncbi:MAG TPA: SUF system Fe-S cluster assembly protein [Vicinamibacterales bacterium]|jgi:FeS assembly SUF system protein|nr:SUF system Fe-S cluster assembly protein [Vicinamibacterales bacterium]
MGLFSFSFLSREKDARDAREAAAAATAPPPGDAAASSLPQQAPGASVDLADVEPVASDAFDVGALTTPAEAPPAETEARVGPPDLVQIANLQQKIIDELKTVYDPEIPVDIYELGLIYDIVIDADAKVLINMTLTSPACPSAQQLPSEVRYKVKAVPGVADAWVDIVWDPPWDKDRMSETAKLQLGFF